jgi:hypothetical protein
MEEKKLNTLVQSENLEEIYYFEVIGGDGKIISR